MPNLEDILIYLEQLEEKIDNLETGNITIDASQVQLNSLSDFGTNESGVPTGQVFVGIFMQDCPSGWTRQSQFDARTIYGASSYGATGGTSGTTTGSHSHGSGSYDTDGVSNHGHTEKDPNFAAVGGPGPTVAASSESTSSTGGAGAHSHNVDGTSGGAGSGGGNWPPYRAVVLCSP